MSRSIASVTGQNQELIIIKNTINETGQVPDPLLLKEIQISSSNIALTKFMTMYINGVSNNFEMQNSKDEVIITIQLTPQIRRVISNYTMSYANNGVSITQETDITTKKYVDDKASATLTSANNYTNQQISNNSSVNGGWNFYNEGNTQIFYNTNIVFPDGSSAPGFNYILLNASPDNTFGGYGFQYSSGLYTINSPGTYQININLLQQNGTANAVCLVQYNNNYSQIQAVGYFWLPNNNVILQQSQTFVVNQTSNNQQYMIVSDLQNGQTNFQIRALQISIVKL